MKSRAEKAWTDLASQSFSSDEYSNALDPSSAIVYDWLENAYRGIALRNARAKIKGVQYFSEPKFLHVIWMAAEKINAKNPLAAIAGLLNQFGVPVPVSEAQADEWLKNQHEKRASQELPTSEQFDRYVQLYNLGYFTKAEHARFSKAHKDEPSAVALENFMVKALRRAKKRGKLAPCSDRQFYPQFASCPAAKPVHIEYCRRGNSRSKK